MTAEWSRFFVESLSFCAFKRSSECASKGAGARAAPGRGWTGRAVVREVSCAGGLELGSGAAGDPPDVGKLSLASVAIPAMLGLGSGHVLGTAALELVR